MNGEVPEGLVLDSTAPGGLSPYPPTPLAGFGQRARRRAEGTPWVKILVYVIRCGDG